MKVERISNHVDYLAQLPTPVTLPVKMEMFDHRGLV